MLISEHLDIKRSPVFANHTKKFKRFGSKNIISYKSSNKDSTSAMPKIIPRKSRKRYIEDGLNQQLQLSETTSSKWRSNLQSMTDFQSVKAQQADFKRQSVNHSGQTSSGEYQVGATISKKRFVLAPLEAEHLDQRKVNTALSDYQNAKQPSEDDSLLQRSHYADSIPLSS